MGAIDKVSESAAPGLFDLSDSLLAASISDGLAIIFVQLEGVICPREDQQLQRFRILDPTPTRLRTERHNGTRFGEDRNIIEHAVDRAPAMPSQTLTGEEIKPVTFRQPDGLTAETGFLLGWFGEGRCQQLRTEPVGAVGCEGESVFVGVACNKSG